MPPKYRKRKEASDGDEIMKTGKKKLRRNDLKHIKDMINAAGLNITYLEIEQGLEEGTLMSYLRETDPDKSEFWDQLEEKLKTVADEGHSSKSAPITRSKNIASSKSQRTEDEVSMGIGEEVANIPVPIPTPPVKKEVSTESIPLKSFSSPEILPTDSEEEGHRERDSPEVKSFQQNQTNVLGSRARDSISVVLMKLKTVADQEHLSKSDPTTRSKNVASRSSQRTEAEVSGDIETMANIPVPIPTPPIKKEVSTESISLQSLNTTEILLTDTEEEIHRNRDGPENNSFQQNQTNDLGSRARVSISLAQQTRSQGRAASFKVEEDPPITRAEYREMMCLMTDVLNSIQRVVDAVDTLTRITSSRLQMQPTTLVTINQGDNHTPLFIQQDPPPRNPQVSFQNGTLSPATTSSATTSSASSTIRQSRSSPKN